MLLMMVAAMSSMLGRDAANTPRQVLRQGGRVVVVELDALGADSDSKGSSRSEDWLLVFFLRLLCISPDTESACRGMGCGGFGVVNNSARARISF